MYSFLIHIYYTRIFTVRYTLKINDLLKNKNDLTPNPHQTFVSWNN